MSKLLRAISGNQNSNNASGATSQSSAADAVERVARRTPALFKTNRVPAVSSQSLSFRHIQLESS